MSEERWLTYAELGQELGISVEAAERRADELKATFDLKEGRYQEIIAQLTDEVSEQRRVTALLVEQMTARRSWWPWRRR